MGFFAKIIEKDARKALNELLDSLKSADNTKARKAISKFYKEHSDNNIRLQQRIIDYLKDWITVGVNIAMEKGNQKNPRQSHDDAFLSTLSQAPTYKPFLPDGRYVNKAYDFESEIFT